MSSSSSFFLHIERGRSVTDRGISLVFALTGLVIIEKFAAHAKVVGLGLPQSSDSTEEHADGMPPADGVPILVEVGAKSVVIKILDEIHTLEEKKRERAYR